jgi:hypothetical protein
MKSEPVRWWIAAPVIAILLVVVPIPDWVVERFYSRGFFPYLQGFVTGLSNLVPLAILDLIILGAAILFVVRIVKLFKAGVFAGAWEGFRRLVRVTGFIVILFVCFWGLNYRRVPLETAIHTSAARPTVDQLQAAIGDANALASRLRSGALWTADQPSYASVDRDLRAPINAALALLQQPLLVTPGRPKYSLILTPFFTWAGVSGMVDPLALESIVNPDLLPFERPFVLAHEWAHLAGHADEAEASAVGWLACMQAGPAMAYSASMYLIVEGGGALPRKAWQETRAKLDPLVRADLDALAKRMERERPLVRRTAFRAYDQYLKINRVDDGVTSYSRALSLILGSPFRDALASYRVSRDPQPR